ncbi:MAG: M14 family metallopeptidase [Cytophagales bacterium]|nr:M14 family metallopeptidase [Cytophagales bacterium]
MNKLSRLLIPILSCHMTLAQNALQTKFERTNGRETVTYAEGMAYYRQLDAAFETIKLIECGPTDTGLPLHVAVLSPDGTFDPEAIRRQGKAVLLVNNAIHPGEPDGVDASMMLLRDLAGDKKLKDKLAHLVLVVVPFYNIGGVLNRNTTTRVNQTGPAEYGFRGNDRNYDLNRDFIKNDTRNARSFAQIYHTWQPDVFVDTHVSNGADYPYVMTLIATQHNKLGGVLGRYLEETFTPKLEKELAARKFDMTPYVNPLKETPDSGLVQFMEWPRYSTGYTALFGTLGFMPETHMLKPYDQRVKSTYALLQSFVKLVNEEHATLLKLRQETRQAVQAQREFVIDWQLDESRHTPISFKGYQARHKPSAVSGQPRLYYDRTKPFTKTIPFYNQYAPKTTVQAPAAYVIPAAWAEVVDRLRLNRIALTPLEKDTTLTVEAYYIEDFQTLKNPFEGHYLHYNAQVRRETQTLAFHRGDLLAYTNQPGNRYLVETLEPQAPDSFFNWNFFDAILQQKEGYSDYVFEDLAADLLARDPQLKSTLEARKRSDPAFAADAVAQLDFVYRHSPYYERTHRRYPVFRLLQQ